MQRNTMRTRLLASSMICAVAALSASAFAQDATVEEVIITGSRIARQDYMANSPVSTVTTETNQAVGSSTTEEFLDRLPQVAPGLSAASSNPSDGAATVDLRDLGPTPPLALVDGRRMKPAAKLNPADLNNIPTVGVWLDELCITDDTISDA